MTQPGFPVETVEALAIAGIGRKQWEHLLRKRLYDAAPETVPGRVRYFVLDDVVCLVLFDHLIRGGMNARMAGRVASAVRTELARGPADLDRLWIVSTRSGVPHRVVRREPPDDLTRQEVLVGHVRRLVLRRAAEIAARSRPC